LKGQLPPLLRVTPPGPRSRKLAARLAAVECPSFEARRGARARQSGVPQAPIAYASAEGANVIDADGNRYVDLVAGFGALPLGHRAPEVDRALREQGSRLGLALGDVYASEVKVSLCETLAKLLPEKGARVLLGLSGADAVTAALKSAVLATGKPGVVAFQGGYHGLSYAPLAACGYSPQFRLPFEAQLGHHVSFAPYPATLPELEASLEAVARALRGGDVGAVLVEPILGRGGSVVPPDAFLPALRRACDEAGALLVVDEIWTGLGRTGAWLASAASDVVADVVCIGKGLGNGLPISACIGRADVMRAWGAHGGSAIHTATHFGSPLACAAATATLAAIGKRRLVQRAARVGARWREELALRTRGLGVREVRGRGLMVGIAVDGGAGRALELTRALLARGYLVLTGGVAGDVLTLTPPLIVEEALLAGFTRALVDVLDPSDRSGPGATARTR
jgi:4-aminobutyrate aminotransferase/(S)-3-amino-2-methylpropionate transaminase